MIQNAQITSTHLGPEDHGIFSFILKLDVGGGSQGFGGYDLTYNACGIPVLAAILTTPKVGTWEELPGTYLRTEHEGGRIVRIGHLIDDKWMSVDEIQARETTT